MARRLWVFILAVVALATLNVHAKDIKITIPKRTAYTPVQRLNREGVDAVRKHNYDKAKALFYKAYLYDPDDPFTLNNLGYIAELEGQLERAQQYYSLASQQSTDAVIEKASTAEAQGQTFRDEIAGVHDRAVQINLANVHAVELLSQGRAPEADLLLTRALTLDPHNPFTLNNIGVAKEMQGELTESLKYYTDAASSHSEEPVMVTLNNSWRGKPVSKMASESAKKVSHRLRHPESAEARAAELNLRGVSAINRNDWRDAQQYFRDAYALDPNNAFSLNNVGYLAEMQGDSETAQVFYEKARTAAGATARVGVATDSKAKGLRLAEVSDENDTKVDTKMTQLAELKRRQSVPIQLKRRDGTPVTAPITTPPAQPGQGQNNTPQ